MAETFHFKTVDGEKLDVPFAKDVLTRKQLREINEKARSAFEAETLTVEKAFDKKTIDFIDNMVVRDYEKFIAGWLEEGTPNVGE